ncbi:MAG: hypothetical protein QME52_03260 [Bacteroidota bacterium]|nr:hypothetical protein [Bacteroidota bacterium]
MKNIILICLFAIPIFSLITSMGCKKSPTESSDHDSSIVEVRKPNIYLYPKAKCNLSIKLLFPLGGRIIQSIPSYQNGWNVEVNPSGKINQQYDFLFYESQTPDAYQYNFGWVVSRDTLSSFFNANLRRTGFNDSEIFDFTEYWVPRLSDYPLYIIYPQYSTDIEKVIQLNISEPPDNILRLFYVIQSSEDMIPKLITPTVPKFVRSGFTVTEWGVILK